MLLAREKIRALIERMQAKLCKVPLQNGEKKKAQNRARQANHRAGQTRVCKWVKNK